MLDIKNLSIEIDGYQIIKNVTFSLNKKDKMAVIGEEGNGKSTLLKVIKGVCDYAVFTGSITTNQNTIGYLEQFIPPEFEEKTSLEYLFLNEFEYYEKINLLYKKMKEINLSEDIIEQKKISDLSGGEKVKLQLLKIVLQDADILLLDEPTNDLDLDTLIWLETLLKQTEKPVLFVSHDETLLESTANQVLHIEQLKRKTETKTTHHNETYKSYLEKRKRDIVHTTQIAKKEKAEQDQREKKLSQIRNKVEYQQNTISRSDPHGGQLLKKKMKSVKSLEKRYLNTELTEIPDVEEQIYIEFPKTIELPRNKQILNIHWKELKIQDKILATDLNLEISGREHIVITGPNGCGKTTFLKQIFQELKKKSDINVGYMPQDYDSILNNFKTPLDFLCEKDQSKEHISKVRSYMGNIKLTKEEMIGNISNLSGGSKAKLFLLKLVLEEKNVLVLDEPTRNVSPLTSPIIRSVLHEFQGTIISVSHDRKYIVEVGETIYEMNENGLQKI